MRRLLNAYPVFDSADDLVVRCWDDGEGNNEPKRVNVCDISQIIHWMLTCSTPYNTAAEKINNNIRELYIRV